MTMLINNIKVSAFGGIPDEIMLDITTPLSVIYAPNGTGKTSIVESLAWMFNAETRTVRCVEANSQSETYVQASISLPGSTKVYKKRRTSAGDEHWIDEEAVKQADFLISLAPAFDVSELNPRTQIARLSAHLSSNRLLRTETLESLIDEDQSESRAQSMADLLGTGAELRSLKFIDLYAGRLRDRLREYRKELGWRIEKRDELTPKVKAAQADISHLVIDASRTLGMQEPAGEGEETYAALQKALQSQLARLETRKREIGELAEIVESGITPNFVAGLTAEHRRQQGKLSEIDIQLHDLAEKIESAAAESRRLLEHQGVVRKGIDLFRRIKSEMGTESSNSSSSSISYFREDARRISERFYDSFAALRALEEFESALAQSEVNRNRLEKLSRELQVVQQSAAESTSLEELESELIAVNTAIAEVEGQLEDLEVARQTLSSAVGAFLEKDPHRTTCPTCLHDWGGTKALIEAIKSAASAFPSGADSKQRSLKELIEQRTDLVRAKHKVEKRTHDSRELEIELAKAEQERLRINNLALDLGFRSIDTVSELDISSLRQRLRRYDSVVTALAWYDGNRHVVERLDESMSVDQLVEALSDHANQLKESIEAIERIYQEHKSARTLAQEQHVATVELCRAADVKCRDAREKLARLDDLRTKLQIEEASREAIEKAHRELIQSSDKLEEARVSITTYRTVLDSHLAKQEYDKLNGEIADVENHASQLSSELDRCTKVATKISEGVDGHKGRLVKAFAPVIEELFQRMQVNRVFQGIDFDSELRLKGLFGSGADTSLNPSDFSQGQRQDLALAFFLTRAYATGGTFFLDEPLVHLDDLNRVSVIDTLRSFVLTGADTAVKTRLVITTSSWTTTRHIMQKFARLDNGREQSECFLRVYQLSGNVKRGVEKRSVYPI